MEYRTKRNKIEYGLEDRINDIISKFNIISIERLVWWEMNELNCRRLMTIYVEIINKIKVIVIEMNKEVVSIEEINEVSNEYEY